jgi:hypothetical protein
MRLSDSAGIQVWTKLARSSKTLHQRAVREGGNGDALSYGLPSIASGSVDSRWCQSLACRVGCNLRSGRLRNGGREARVTGACGAMKGDLPSKVSTINLSC